MHILKIYSCDELWDSMLRFNINIGLNTMYKFSIDSSFFILKFKSDILSIGCKLVIDKAPSYRIIFHPWFCALEKSIHTVTEVS